MSSVYRKALSLLDHEPSPLISIDSSLFSMAGVRVYLKRDDLLDQQVSGNKWRKLLPQLAWQVRAGALGFASVGGLHSNHLAALAALGKKLGIPTLGFVRAWDGVNDSPTTAFAKTQGMELRPVTRTLLRAWRSEGGGPAAAELGGLAWLPEGGATRLGILGLAHCARELRVQLGAEPTAIFTAAGTGTTAAGLARAGQAQVYGVLCVRDEGVSGRAKALLGSSARARLHFIEGALGGFASGEEVLLNVMERFFSQHQVWLDPIYTAKAYLALEAELSKGRFRAGDTIVMLHTGGHQGRQAWLERYYPTKAAGLR